MGIEVSNLQTNMNVAQTPEEAARFFLGEVSKGLAQLVADKLAEVKSQILLGSKSNSSIAGWEEMITGGLLCIDWDTAKFKGPQHILCSFAAGRADSVSPASIDMSIGISIRANF
ncbi:hypothetical protein [Paramagnetospirillum caucaseum]|uniref:hypothetical protein n=1 Tax=Paramagnetospirillum caucaseum TaxID=1244869 RepID=UPI0012694E25|nr:hypothetical protein [Paramagnetospirillum caucaseum]